MIKYQHDAELYETVIKLVHDKYPDKPFVGLILISQEESDTTGIAYYSNACPVCMAAAIFQASLGKPHMNHPGGENQAQNRLANKKPSLN
jgi:hypothetical protein